MDLDSGIMKILKMICLHKVSPLIAKNIGFNQYHFGDFCWQEAHGDFHADIIRQSDYSKQKNVNYLIRTRELVIFVESVVARSWSACSTAEDPCRKCIHSQSY